MRYVWLDRGSTPDFAKAEREGINGFCFDILDPRLTKAYMNSVRWAGPGYAVVVYAAYSEHPMWKPLFSPSGARHAELVHERLETIAPGTGNSFPKVQFDIEVHDAAVVRDCIKRWRQLRPTRDTSWTLESFQAGWMTDELVQTVIDNGIRVVPQYYTGDMRPFAQDIAKQNLVRRGYPEALVTGMYDAAHLPINWDGYAFIQGRLP
jgi:hypothetical protein